MKNLLVILTILISTLSFTSNSFAEWTYIGESKDVRIYIDFERIRKKNDKIFWWGLTDYKKRTPSGDLSAVVLREGNCLTFQYKILSDMYFSRPMGKGEMTGGSDIPDKNWKYAKPKSLIELQLKTVCR